MRFSLGNCICSSFQNQVVGRAVAAMYKARSWDEKAIHPRLRECTEGDAPKHAVLHRDHLVRCLVISFVRRARAICYQTALEAPVISFSHSRVDAHVRRDASQ